MTLPDLTRASGALLLAAALVACGPARLAGHANASSSFDRAELIDVFGPERVPAIDRPSFEPATEAVGAYGRADAVVVVSLAGNAKAYPLRILIWHEVVDDFLGGVPVAVTYSPTSDGTVVYGRRVGERTLTLGTSGKLYRATLVLYDRETKTLWPQMLGSAVAGPMKGRSLERLPAIITSLGAFADAHPGGSVLAEPAFGLAYGITPYQGYGRRTGPSRSFFLRRADERLGAMERVVGVSGDGGPIAYPVERVARAGAINDRGLVVFAQPASRPVLDRAEIAAATPDPTAAVFRRALDGRTLTFRSEPGGFTDAETGSRWDTLGRATAGPLAGRRLEPVPATPCRWFSWATFNPSTSVFGVG